MNSVVMKICRLAMIPVTLLFLQTVAVAQPTFIPGFLGVESSYIERPASGADSTEAFLTLTNLHPREPLVILDISGGMFEESSMVGANGEELENIVLQPGERLVMSDDGVHVVLNGVDASMLADHGLELTLFIRRGLEPEDPVEAREATAFGPPAREAGIPNEKEYMVSVEVRN